jgi:hypothetical protein
MKYFISTLTALCFTFSVSMATANNAVHSSKHKSYSSHVNNTHGRHKESYRKVDKHRNHSHVISRGKQHKPSGISPD